MNTTIAALLGVFAARFHTAKTVAWAGLNPAGVFAFRVLLCLFGWCTRF
jgi:hypothetical protein